MQMPSDPPRQRDQHRVGAGVLAVLAVALFIGIPFTAPPVTQAGGDVGYVDFPFGPATTPTPSSGFQDLGPTAAKPQSKLWYNDGSWWGVLLNGTTRAYNIYRLDWQTQVWTDTGTVVDNRSTSHADALWDGTALYVATAVPPGDPGNTAIHVLRYTYDAGSRTYALALDSVPASGGVEAVVLDRDSTGTVWVSYTLDINATTRAVYVTHSTGAGDFIAPYIIPVAGAATLSNDDVAAIVAFNGRVGVMWSNQTDDAMYFAIHADGTGEDAWQGGPAYIGPHYADDHLNLKSLNADPAGQVFAVIKTSVNDPPPGNPDDPLLVVLVLPSNGAWYARTFSRVQDRHTRPLLLIDSTNRQLYVFAATNSGEMPSAIYYKQSSLDNVEFPVGAGTPFIASSTHPNINNPTSTKQTLTAATGLLVEASDLASGYYLHNIINLPGAGATPTPTGCTVQFSDVGPTDPFYPFVRCLACRGIISGYGDGTFRPGSTITRGQLSKMTVNAAGFGDVIPSNQQTFADVPSSNPFWVYIEILAGRGYISGYSCGGVGEPCDGANRPYFRPAADVTRGQIAKIEANAAQYTDPVPSTQQTFEDVPASNPFWVFVERVALQGVISGYGCGGVGEPCIPPDNRPYFRAGTTATRGQSSKIVANTFYPGCQTPGRP